MSAVKKSRTVTRKAELTFSTQDVEASVVAAVVRDNRELKDYRFVVEWADDGGCTVTGTQTSGDGETADA